MSLLTTIRRLKHGGSDQERASARERQIVEAAFDHRNDLSRRLAEALGQGGPGAAELGTMLAGGNAVRLPAKMLVGHTGIWGPSGAGKTYMCVLMLTSLLRAGLRRMVVFDPKGETIGLLKRSIISLAKTLPAREAESLLSSVVLIDPYAQQHLPRLQVLSAAKDADPEVLAYSVARLITDQSDSGGVGVRQEAVLHRALECLIIAGLPVTALPQVLLNPGLLDALAEGSPQAEVFRGTAERLRQENKERLGGVIARAERLLRLSSTRLALGGAPDCIDFGTLLDNKIVLVNLEPPEGSVDIGRFIAGILWVKLTQAVRRRPNGSPPAIIVLEEAPAFLAAGSSQAGDMTEDLLRLARSKGVFMYLLSQDLISMGKISSTLPTVIKTNLHLHAFFRTTDDWNFALPVTGRRLKAAAPPWQEQRAAYLDTHAELTLLREELAKLPDRHCYLLDRRTGLPAALIRTADLRLSASDAEIKEFEEHALTSVAVMQVPALKQGLHAVEARLRGLSGVAPVAPSAPRMVEPAETPKKRLPATRGKRPIEMG